MLEYENDIPMRVIPTFSNDSIIVRCQCRLRQPSGEMIRCTRCGCYSHKKCVKIQDPFICNYCHIASQKILLEQFNKTSTPSGILIDRNKLHNYLTNEKSMIKVCELREHSYACGHIAELLRNLITYLASLDLSLCHLERHIEDPVYDPIRDQVKEDISNNRKLFIRHVTILMQIVEKYENEKKKQNILPDFRDAIVQELL